MPIDSPDAATPIEHLTASVKLSGLDLPQIVLPEDRTAVLHGMRFHYLDWNAASRPTLLFLHGARLTAHTWDVVCLALSQPFHCVALDARGHGDSDWAPDGNYSPDAHLSDVEALVEHLGLDRFVLVGMSMGGGTALGYAGRHSDRLQALVIVDAGPSDQPGFVPPGAQRIRDFVTGPAELETLEQVVDRALAFNPARDRRLLRRSLLNNMRQLPSGHWVWKYDREGLGHRTAEQAEERRITLLQAIPRIQCPTLVIRGARSDMFSDEDAERLASSLPDGRWRRVENAGHTVQGDNPKGLLEALTPFLDEAGV